ncbi:hypothetical protein [Azohydromonas lata]|uniref:hypothetical protein n=1 Tax=Azohydromonas lata TaxID=45677 RepID=UPI00082DDDB4|nr:hypothetical protein [Azohydromonas lata]
MTTLLTRCSAAAARHVPDVLGVCGASAIAYGASLIYVPAGWIVGGAIALAVAVLSARKADAP